MKKENPSESSVLSQISDIRTDIPKEEVLRILESTPIQIQWDAILSLETKLYFQLEISYIQKNFNCWENAHTVLDIGCGNGDFTAQLAGTFPDKNFVGIDENQRHIEAARKQHALANLSFECADSHVLEKGFVHRYDIVFMRLVLQHLRDKDLVLRNIYNYLKPKGRVLIIESVDYLRHSSMSSNTIDELFKKINSHFTDNRIDRTASLSLMKKILSKQSNMHKLFKIEKSNISPQGESDYESEKELHLNLNRKNKHLLFAQKLGFFSICKKEYSLDVDLSEVYDLYKGFVDDEEAYDYLGVHFLCLGTK